MFVPPPGLTLALALLVTAAEPAPDNPFELGTILSGGTGAAVVGVLWWIGRTVIDRTLPSRSDARASTSLVLESLNNMVKVLQEEKSSDAERLKAKQVRIDELEGAADKDYDRIRELRTDVLDLQSRLAQKDRHINTLVSELRRLGAQVTGLELDDIEVTSPAAQVQRVRHEMPELKAEVSDTGPSAR